MPFHMQVIDKFAMSIVNESIWISGRAGEQRFCGGCHENRTDTTLIAPGVQENVLRGAVNLDVPAHRMRGRRPTSATARSAACRGTWPSSRS